jgi:hypothetical protein
MKNSSKFLLTAMVVFLFVSSVIYSCKGADRFKTSSFSNNVAFEEKGSISGGKSYNVASFDALKLRSAARVKIISGPKARVEVLGNKEYISSLQVFAEGSNLHIELADNLRFSFRGEPEITVITPSPIKDISLVGSNHIYAKKLSGLSLSINAEGSSHCEFAGQVGNLKINTAGSSNIDVVRTAGSSHIEVYAKDSLKIDAFGSSHINYFGHPKKVTKTVFGSSRIEENGD